MDWRCYTHPAASQMAGARTQRLSPSPPVTHPLSSELATRLPSQPPFPGIAGPYKYSAPKFSTSIPNQSFGLASSPKPDQTNCREPDLPCCDVLELDPNTLQPDGYPGRTPLEWCEMAQAIHDVNHKRYQPGKSVSVHHGGGILEESCPACGDLAVCDACTFSSSSHHDGPKTHCLHCGSPDHALERCDHPPLFRDSVPQHVTLDRYLQTAHWKRKANQTCISRTVSLQGQPFDAPDPSAPLTCAVCPDLPHLASEVSMAVECVATHLRAEGKPVDFDWRGYWMVDFSQCPFMWGLRPVDDRGKMYLVFNPTGSVAVRELVLTAEEALKRRDKSVKVEEASGEVE